WFGDGKRRFLRVSFGFLQLERILARIELIGAEHRLFAALSLDVEHPVMRAVRRFAGPAFAFELFFVSDLAGDGVEPVNVVTVLFNADFYGALRLLYIHDVLNAFEGDGPAAVHVKI